MEFRSGQSFISPVLVGREKQLHELKAVIDRARQGHGHVVLISGEAGVGKSRLVGEARIYAARRAFRVLEAGCFETDASIPCAPISDIVRLIFADLKSRPQPELDHLKRDLLMLAPEYANESTGGSLPAEPEQKKRHLLNCLVQLLLTMAQDQPLMLVVEDIHWSDESSLEALYHMTRRGIGASILVIMTYRAEEVAPALRHWLAQWDRDRVSSEFALEPLSHAVPGGCHDS